MKSKILAAVLAAMLLLALTACGEKLRTKRFRSKNQYASMHRVSSFQGKRGSLRPFARHGRCNGAQQALFYTKTC